MLIMMARVMKYATNGLQGNKEKTPPTSRNHFKRTISLLYILYCANCVNWTKSSVLAVKVIRKLDPFNNVTQFINGHFREHYHDLLYSFNGDIHNGKPTLLSNDGNDASVLLTPERKRTKTSTKLLAHSKVDNSLQRNSLNSYSPSESKTMEMEIKIVNFPIKRQNKLCTVAKNKLKHLIKWKIRKKLAKCTTKTNKIKRSVNNNANNSTLMTTNYDTASIMTTKKSTESQFKSTTAFNSRNGPAITTQFTPIAITPINSITQIESSNRPIKSQQQSLNRSIETNVFEMATKLKYNKLAKSKVIPDESRKGKISLLGLFELSTRDGLRTEGQSELAAAQMAVRHINSKRILNGYTIELLTNDTKVNLIRFDCEARKRFCEPNSYVVKRIRKKLGRRRCGRRNLTIVNLNEYSMVAHFFTCDPGVGVDRFFHALYTQLTTRMVMLLGSACSEVTESLAKVVPYWNIVQVSFGSTSPALSDRSEFPLFYRTVAPDSSHNPARIAFIRRFGWDTVTTFSQNEEIHSLAVNDLVTELESANISCAATITFAETDFKDQLKMLRDLDTRIIIGSFSLQFAPKIFCEAYKLGMYGADYAWILHETIGPPWWKQSTEECSQKNIADAAQNVLVVSSYNSIVGDRIGKSGLSNKMFKNELAAFHNPHPMSRYAPQTYDAVWAIALAMRGAEEHWRNNSLSSKLDGFDYTRYDMTSEFMNQFHNMSFLGVSGPVSFSGADRIGYSIFYQIQHGRLQPVALYHPSGSHLDFDCPECVQIKWKGGQVPIAKRIFKLRVATIAPFAFYTITSFASVGITLSIAFLAFNLHFRKLKSIKLSSPKLSNITTVGCIFVYAAVVLLGIIPSNDKAFSAVCTARVSLLSSGFSLAFGSMFAKTYRVHRIFTHSGGGVCKDKMLRDTQLISLVCALLLLDGLVVTLWVIADPMERHLSNLTLEISSTDRSVVYQPQVEVCRSQNTQSWLGALYAYKGLLLIVGVYMAWETRNVKIPALNDSQYIGVSVYSVVITSAIIVVLANFLAEKVTLAFVTITALILASTTATLSLLFLPKINDIWGKGVINDPVIHSMGLKMECNTRRFVTDDRRELQYRVEVQNRVYKKEMAALDAEIVKLQKMLESNSSTSSSDLSMLQSIKHEIAIVNECISGQKKSSDTRTPSIGGGLPLLLLSVLPPVIPRASWPSSDHCMINPMRQSVTFSSQPQLDNDGRQSGVARLPAIDLFNLRLTHQQATAEARTGILDRIKGMFVSANRKDSTISYTEASQALRRHMTRLTGIVSYQATSSCNTLDTGNKHLNNQIVAQSGTAINISYPSNEELGTVLPPFIISNSLTESSDEINAAAESEGRVFFQLPKNRRPSILHQNSQPTLRERVKGSPRFPHRIAPTSSLSALQEGAYKVSTIELSDTGGSKTKWKSMEESTFSTTLPNSSTAVPSDVRNQIKPPVQLSSSIKSEIQTSSNDDDDDDDVKEDDGDCVEFGENVECNYVKTQPETVSDL